MDGSSPSRTITSGSCALHGAAREEDASVAETGHQLMLTTRIAADSLQFGNTSRISRSIGRGRCFAVVVVQSLLLTDDAVGYKEDQQWHLIPESGGK